jgi:hypothetical protein
MSHRHGERPRRVSPRAAFRSDRGQAAERQPELASISLRRRWRPRSEEAGGDGPDGDVEEESEGRQPGVEERQDPEGGSGESREQQDPPVFMLVPPSDRRHHVCEPVGEDEGAEEEHE